MLCLLLLYSGGSRGLAQDFNSHGPMWTYDEGYKAYRLIVQKRDYSLIDQAFELREPDLLFDLYRKADGNRFGVESHDPALAGIATISSDEERRRLNEEVKKRVLDRLRQMPGLARYIGDHIESSMETPLVDQIRFNRISDLTILANDDSIVQFGRFLFDRRNPDAFPKDRPRPPVVYETQELQFYMTSALISVLRNMPGIAAELKSFPKGEPGWIERAQNWWLKSPEAAPYRRKLVELGVRLPPGYPPMAELGGEKVEINNTQASAQQSEPSASPAEQGRSLQPVWLVICVALVLLAVLLTIRRK